MLVRLLIPLLLTIAISPCHADEMDDSREAIDFLKDLDIEDLIDVEVTLDDVFDVFDGLVKARTVSIATGDKQSIARAPSVTSVITAQDIEAIGARDIDEALEAVPGLHMAREPLGYKPVYTIRGMYSDNNREVLVLINGIPLTSVYTGNRGLVWGGMPVNAIARIEVIRGPGSAVYGADAFGGVINIITKSKEDIDGTEMGVRAGSFSTGDAWILHGEQWAGFDVALALEYQTTDGQREVIDADAQTSYDNAPDTNASLAPGPVNLQGDNVDIRLDVLRGNWQLRAGYQGRRNMGTGAGVAHALDPNGHHSADRINADLTYHNQEFTRYWDVTAQFSVFNTAFEAKRDHRLFPPGAFGGTYPDGFIGNPGTSERHTRFDTSGFYSGFMKHLIRIGTGYHTGDFYKSTETKNFGTEPSTGLPLPPGSPVINVSDTSAAFIQERERKAWYLSLQDTWSFAPDWEFTAGLRYDHYSDFGKTVNPRLALVWQPFPDFASKLLYGSAFRAPAFVDLYNANNPLTLGNPDLKPETIKTWELAFDYRATNNLHLAMNLFNYDATDKILFIPDAGGNTATAQNAGKQDGHGIELEARWKPTTKSSLLVNYAFQKATDENDHHIGNAPQHSAYLRTDWLLYPNWYLDTQVNWIAKRKRTPSDYRTPIDDYTTMDLTLRYKDIKQGNWNFAVGVRNLVDADVREPSPGPGLSDIVTIPNDLPLAGRNYFLELRYRF